MKPFNVTERRGTTLIESLVAVSLLVMLVIVVGAMAKSFAFSRQLEDKFRAHLLASEELDAWRLQSFSALTNRSATHFSHILYQKGSYLITDQNPQAGSHAVAFNSHQGSSGITAIAPAPLGPYVADATINAYFLVPLGTTSPWAAGILFRAYDEHDGYVLKITNASVELVKRVNDIETSIFSSVQVHNVNTWYKIEVVASGSTFTVKRNDVTLTTPTVSDATYATGWLGMVAYSGVSALFDTASIQIGSLTSWSFDDASESLSTAPKGWKRAGIYEVQNGNDDFTISDAVADASSPLKELTAQLTWGASSNFLLQVKTYVAQTGILQ